MKYEVLLLLEWLKSKVNGQAVVQNSVLSSSESGKHLMSILRKTLLWRECKGCCQGESRTPQMTAEGERSTLKGGNPTVNNSVPLNLLLRFFFFSCLLSGPVTLTCIKSQQKRCILHELHSALEFLLRNIAIYRDHLVSAAPAASCHEVLC